MEIKKWHIYLADLNPRYGVVIQTNLLNDAGHPSTLICPITTKVITRAKVLRVHLHKKEGGLAVESDILIDQIRAIDNKRFRKHLGIIGKQSRMRLMNCLKIVLDF